MLKEIFPSFVVLFSFFLSLSPALCQQRAQDPCTCSCLGSDLESEKPSVAAVVLQDSVILI